MCPADILWLGFTHLGKIYFDVTLSMGSAWAAFCCQRTTNAIPYVYQKQGYEDVNYLDDLGAAEEEAKAEEAFDCLGWILSTVGIKESVKKAKHPAVICVFLGILFNTLTMTLQITPERLNEITELLNEWSKKKYCNLREVQSLLGKLNFACNTVRAGRVFVARIINELKKFKDQKRRKVTQQLHQDVRWWIKFMKDFDGITIMPPLHWDAPDRIFSTDACLQACGGWMEGTCEAFHTDFPEYIKKNKSIHINELELLAFVIAIKVFEDSLHNRNILAYCDNQVSVEVVNSGAASNEFSQHCLREICFVMAKCNSMLRLVHLSGESNRICDSLSRWSSKKHREKFAEITKGMDVQFIHVPNSYFNFEHDW